RDRGPVGDREHDRGDEQGVGRRAHDARARSRLRSCALCQSWKVAVAGVIVSLISTTGMPLALALSTRALTSGVEFWALKTRTLICLVATCLSTVALSAAVGSSPSFLPSISLMVRTLRPLTGLAATSFDAHAS